MRDDLYNATFLNKPMKNDLYKFTVLQISVIALNLFHYITVYAAVACWTRQVCCNSYHIDFTFVCRSIFNIDILSVIKLYWGFLKYCTQVCQYCCKMIPQKSHDILSHLKQWVICCYLVWVDFTLPVPRNQDPRAYCTLT